MALHRSRVCTAWHKFPVHWGKRKEWVSQTRRDNFSPSSDTVLCSDHFAASCFDRTGQTIRLREDSVPTIFLFPDGFEPQLPAPPPLPPLNKKLQTPLKIASKPSLQASNVTSDHCYALACPESAKKKIEELQRKNEQLQKAVRSNRQRERRLARKCKETADILDGLKSTYVLPSDKAAEVLQSVLGTVSLTLLHTELDKSQ